MAVVGLLALLEGIFELLLHELGGYFFLLEAVEEGGLPTALAWGAGAFGGWAHEKVGG